MSGLYQGFFLLMMIFQCLSVNHSFANTKDLNEQVTIQLSWKYQYEFAPIIAAYEKGFFHQEGLNVKILEGEPDLNPVDQVLNGKADYGVFSSALVVRYAHGDPVVALAALMQHSAVGLVTKKTSDITSVHDLKGKTIALSHDTRDEILAYLIAMGINRNDLIIVDKKDIQLEKDLNYANAVSIYISNEGFEVSQRENEFQIFNPRAAGIDLFGNILFTSKDHLVKKPDQVKAFVKAVKLGLDYSENNKEEIIDLILSRYNSQHKSREHLKFEADTLSELIRLDIVEAGYMSPGRWRHVADVYAKQGKMSFDTDLTPFIYNPNQHIDIKPYIWGLAITLSLLILLAGIIWQSWRYNKKLKNEINNRKLIEENLKVAQKQAYSANNAKNLFLSAMHHEFRTPLNAILGFSQLIESSKIDDNTKKDAREIYRAGNSLLSMLDGILHLVNIESGNFELSIEDVISNILINAVVRDIQLKVRKRLSNIANQIDCQSNIHIKVDVKYFKLALEKILEYAINLNSHDNTIIINGKQINDYFEIYIILQNSELAELDLQQIFTPFEIINIKETNFDSISIGLPLARKLIELMHGDLRIERQREQGCRFVISVPLSL